MHNYFVDFGGFVASGTSQRKFQQQVFLHSVDDAMIEREVLEVSCLLTRPPSHAAIKVD